MIRLLLIILLLIHSAYPADKDVITKNIKQEIIKHKNNLPNGDLRQIAYVKNLIDYMYEFDQKFRKLVIQYQNDEQLKLLLIKSNRFHTTKVKQILKIYGWVTISKFGVEYDQKAWLLVQHADEDPFFQAGVLFVLQNLIAKKETDKKNYAYLYDRVAAKFNKIGILQKYGTQVDMVNFKIQLQPYQGNLADINKNRQEIGLEPLAIYLEKIKNIYQ